MRTIATGIATVVLTSGLLAGSLSGQGGRAPMSPARDTPQQATGTGVIAGAVRTAGTGAPVRRARVRLAAPELQGGRTVLTDDEGRFVFVALPAGRYTLSASKAGFVDMAYGANRPGRAGTPIQLANGQTIDRLSLSLPRGSVITGTVVDEYGEPAAGIQVRAMQYVMQTGERRLQMAGQDQTDDRGIYRIYQLQPGDYVVSAVPRNRGVSEVQQFVAVEMANIQQSVQAAAPVGSGPVVVQAQPMPAEVGQRLAVLQRQLETAEDLGGMSYAPVFFPGTTNPASAQAVTLGVGEERGGVNFQLQLVNTTTVKGLVVAPGGMAPAGTTVALLPRAAGVPDVPGMGSYVARVGGDGRFALDGVAPGDYVLQARAPVRDPAAEAGGPGRGGRGGRGRGPVLQVLWASTDLAVTGQPLPDIVLNLREGMTVSGSVQFEGNATPPDDLSTIRVMLEPRGARAFEIGGTLPTEVDASGQFRIPGVSPGTYALTAAIGFGGRGRNNISTLPPAAPGAGGPTDWRLASAIHNGRDLLDFPIEIQPNQNLSNVILRWTTTRQELSGTIQDTSGIPTSDYTIIVFPSASEYWQPQSRRISATRPATDGRFTFNTLPPGDYRLTAVTDVEPGEWFDPSFLSQLAGASIPITLNEGERKVQDIRVAGG
jgi:uncharacterized protein (DUF2141 family)